MENEIKVNEYVRTKDGYIAKYVKDGLRSGTIDIEDNTVSWVVDNSNILKHSEKLIDLIQCGDYVNGIKIISIIQQADTMKTISLCGFDNDYLNIELNNRDIKTVVTKEQFESISYKTTKM